MVLPQGSSSSSAEAGGPGALGAPPRHFERAITWTRVAGAVAALLITPLFPNLGIGYVLALSGFLVAWAIVLHVLSGTATTEADQDAITKVAFVGDCIVIFLGMLVITPEPNWMLFPLFAVLFIITAAFRLGDLGAGLATLIVSLEFVGIAIWRENALGLPIQVPYLAFILVLYSLTALIVSAMLREVGVMRRERTALIRDASDVGDLRRADSERRELLERRPHAALASDHADIARLGIATRQLPQAVVVVAMSARDEDDARPGPDLDVRQGVGEIGDEDALGAREPLGRRELGPVVEHGDPEVEHAPDEGEGLGDVAGADDHELGRRLPALDVDLGAARQGVTAGPAGGLEQGARQGGHRRGAEIAVVAAPVPRQPPPHQRRVLGLDDDGRRRLPALGDRAPGDGQGVRHVEAAAHETTSRR